jgi:hypothetical protein
MVSAMPLIVAGHPASGSGCSSQIAPRIEDIRQQDRDEAFGHSGIHRTDAAWTGVGTLISIAPDRLESSSIFTAIFKIDDETRGRLLSNRVVDPSSELLACAASTNVARS